MNNKRLSFIDSYRGLLIICMVIYHFLIDLNIYGILSRETTYGTPLNLFQAFIAWGFILISGFSCTLSKNNLNRGLLTLGCAVVISLGTYLFNPEYFVVFGILHFLGCAMIISAAIDLLPDKIPAAYQTVGFLALFAVFYMLNIQYPRPMVSSDYFPVIPWIFLFLTGRAVGLLCKKQGFPKFFYRVNIPFLSTIGKHTLIIYMLHQPLLIGILILVLKII